MKKRGLIKIWSMFRVFLVLFILNFGIKTDITQTAMMWLVLDICIALLSIVMLIKNKLPQKKQILVSLLLGLFMFVAYRGISFTAMKNFLIIFLSMMAAFSIFNTYKVEAIHLIKDKSTKSILISVLIGFLIPNGSPCQNIH